MSEPKMPDDYAEFMRDLSARSGVEIDVDEAWEEGKKRIAQGSDNTPSS